MKYCFLILAIGAFVLGSFCLYKVSAWLSTGVNMMICAYLLYDMFNQVDNLDHSIKDKEGKHNA